jgi:hypothetical protein
VIKGGATPWVNFTPGGGSGYGFDPGGFTTVYEVENNVDVN